MARNLWSRLVPGLWLLVLTTDGVWAQERQGVGEIRKNVAVLAADSMLGRNTGSPELERAALYLASELREAGVKPLGDMGSFFQRFVLRWRALERGGTGLLVGDDRLLVGSDARIVFMRDPPAAIEGELVLVRPGVVPGSEEAEAVAGAIAVMPYPGPYEPGWLDSAANQAVSLFALRPRNLVIATDRPPERYSEEGAWMGGGFFQRTWEGRQSSFVGGFLEIRREALDSLLRARGKQTTAQLEDARPVVATGVAASVAFPVGQVKEISVPNVVGIVPGRGPLGSESIVLTAHYDHLGHVPEQEPDSVFNGADDNASGVAAILHVARTLAGQDSASARRSVIVLFSAAEELGLWGSEYFVANPGTALERVIANVNADMVGRVRDGNLIAVGMEFTTLGSQLADFAASSGSNIRIVPDDRPDESLFTRSDHYNFALRGIPALNLTSGLHTDYHRETDEPGRINYVPLAETAELLAEFVAGLARSDERPRWLVDWSELASNR